MIHIKKETEKYPDLKTILDQLKSGGSVKNRDGLYDLQSGCIIKGNQVYIPKVFRNKILEELHEGHLGVVRMKALARSTVYWPKINDDIETMVKSCKNCMENAKMPTKMKTHHWEYPSKPWERIHVDFAGPFQGHIFFLIIDAHSKWPEIFITKSMTSKEVIKLLHDTFSRYGLPCTLVSDNQSTFTSDEFQRFMNIHGIKHVTCAPFHPSSNGQAERYVDTMKRALKSLE